MSKSMKQALRTIYKIKREKIVAISGESLTIQLKKQMMGCFSQIQSTDKKKVQLIGSYIPDKSRQITPPFIENYKYSYPWFIKKDKGEKTPLMEFKVLENNKQKLELVYGIQIPSKQLPTVYPNIVFVPLTCFHSISKQRLGYGGGFYDCYINYIRNTLYKKTIFIGIGAQCLKINEQFWSNDDQPLDYVITETNIY